MPSKRIYITNVGVVDIPAEMTAEEWFNQLDPAEIDRLEAQAPKGRHVAKPSIISELERRVALEQQAGVPVGVGGLSLGQRFMLPAGAGLEKQRAALMDMFPGATEDDIMAIRDPSRSEGYALLVRPPGGTEFIEAESLGIGPMDVAAAGGAVLGQGLTSALLVPGLRLANPFLARQAATAIGGGAGAGLVSQDPSDIAGAAGMELAFNLPGEAASAAWRTTTGAIEDIPIETLRRLDELRAAGLDVPPLYRTPAGQYIAQRAAVTSAAGKQRHLDVFERAARYLRNEMSTLSPATTTDELADVVKRTEQRLVQGASTLPRTAPEAVSAGALAGMEDWTRAYRELVDRRYTDLRRVAFDQDIRFDIASSKEDMRRIALGYTVPQVGEEGVVAPGTVIGLPRGAAKAVKQFLAMPDEVTHYTPVRGVATSSFDQLKDIRYALDNSLSGDAVQDSLVYQARDVITSVLENPVGGSPEYKAALNRANRTYRRMATTLDVFQTRKLMRELAKDPMKAGAHLITPEAPDRVGRIKHMMVQSGRAERWNEVRGGYFDLLLRDPSRIGAELKRWDGQLAAKHALMSKPEEQMIRGVQEAHEQFIELNADPLFIRGRQMGRAAFEALMAKDTRTLRTLVAEAGGKDSPLGHFMQAGMIGEVLKAEEKIEGRTVINAAVADSTARRLIDDEELFDIVGTPKLRAVLANVRDYLSFLPWSADPGTSIYGSQMAGRRMKFMPELSKQAPFINVPAIGAQMEVSKYQFVAWLLGRNAAYEALATVKSLGKRVTPERVRLAGPLRLTSLLYMNSIFDMQNDIDQLSEAEKKRYGLTEPAPPIQIQESTPDIMETIRGLIPGMSQP